MSPLVSVIIPCYNSGTYLPEALASVEAYQGSYAYEIIIINDGSTDAYTLEYLRELETRGYSILHQENKGAAAARNTGVRAAQGKYLLLLDSDNRIRPAYLEKGIPVLESRPDVGVVYGNAHFFGDTTRKGFKAAVFDGSQLFISNALDMCTLVRKTVWEQVGGLDEQIPGCEDWEFWIRVTQTDWQFFHISETLFDYRIRSGSLSDFTNLETDDRIYAYIYAKHARTIREQYQMNRKKARLYDKAIEQPFRYFFKFIFNKYFKKTKDNV